MVQLKPYPDRTRSTEPDLNPMVRAGHDEDARPDPTAAELRDRRRAAALASLERNDEALALLSKA